jgi:hypothetical protein
MEMMIPAAMNPALRPQLAAAAALMRKMMMRYRMVEKTAST